MIRLRSVAGFFREITRGVAGTASVEFSLFLFFILIPFLLGMFEVGRALEQHHVVTKAVRDAARYVARTKDDTKVPAEKFTVASPIDPGCAGTGTIVGLSSPAAAGNAKDLAMYGKFIPVPADTPLMAAWDAAANSAAYQTVCIYGPVAVNTGTLTVDVVTVTAMVPFEGILLQAFGIGPITFEVSHQERYIGE